MLNSMFRKGLVLGLIILLVGASFIQPIAISLTKGYKTSDRTQ